MGLNPPTYWDYIGFTIYPIGSMYGIFAYIWLIFMIHVGKYTSPMDPMGTWLPSTGRTLPVANFPDEFPPPSRDLKSSSSSLVTDQIHWTQHRATYGVDMMPSKLAV